MHMYLFVHMYVYRRMYIHIYAYPLYIYVYIYIHIHIYVYTPADSFVAPFCMVMTCLFIAGCINYIYYPTHGLQRSPQDTHTTYI